MVCSCAVFKPTIGQYMVRYSIHVYTHSMASSYPYIYMWWTLCKIETLGFK